MTGSRVHAASFAIAALLLMPWLGLLGCGLAQVRVLASYLVIHLQVGRIFAFRDNCAAPWLAGLSSPLFASLACWPSGLAFWLPVLAIPLSHAAREQVRAYRTSVRKCVA
jgi:hypothetical protein